MEFNLKSAWPEQNPLAVDPIRQVRVPRLVKTPCPNGEKKFRKDINAAIMFKFLTIKY